MNPLTKPSWMTGEFWLVVLTAVASILGYFTNHVDGDTATYLTTASSIIYMLIRNFQKGKQADATTEIARALIDGGNANHPVVSQASGMPVSTSPGQPPK